MNVSEILAEIITEYGGPSVAQVELGSTWRPHGGLMRNGVGIVVTDAQGGAVVHTAPIFAKDIGLPTEACWRLKAPEPTAQQTRMSSFRAAVVADCQDKFSTGNYKYATVTDWSDIVPACVVRAVTSAGAEIRAVFSFDASDELQIQLLT